MGRDFTNSVPVSKVRCRALGILATAMMGIGLASCGFQPMHAGGHQAQVAQALAGIDLASPGSRADQLLVQGLRNYMPRPNSQSLRYRLDYTISETITRSSINIDDTAERARLSLTVDYRLIALASDETVLSGQERAINTYNVLDAQYAGEVMEDAARRDAVREAAQDIAQRLAAFSSGGPTS